IVSAAPTPPPASAPLPYTTLFRSVDPGDVVLGDVRPPDGARCHDPVPLDVPGVRDALVGLVEPVLQAPLQPLPVDVAVGVDVLVVEADGVAPLPGRVLEEGTEAEGVQARVVVGVGLVPGALAGGDVLLTGLQDGAVGDHGLGSVPAAGLSPAVVLPAGEVDRRLPGVGDPDALL